MRKDGEKVDSAVVWSKAKLPAGVQVIVEQVVLKLLVEHSFHYLANDGQQRNWPVLIWISLRICLVDWDDKGSLPLVRESTFAETELKETASSAQHSFKTPLGARSGPEALSGLRRRRVSVMSLGLKTTLSRLEGAL